MNYTHKRALCALFVCAAVFSTASADSERDDQFAKNYLLATGAVNFKRDSLEAISDSFKAQFKKLASSRSSKRSVQILERYRERTINLYTSKIDWLAIERAQITSIQSSLSDVELREVTEFLNSDLGKKVVLQQQAMSTIGTDLFRSQSINLQSDLRQLYQELSKELRAQ